jgi:hypothetical protein
MQGGSRLGRPWPASLDLERNQEGKLQTRVSDPIERDVARLRDEMIRQGVVDGFAVIPGPSGAEYT